MLGCAEAEDEALRRLHERAHHLHDEVSLAHFYACIVPFERLSNRALRDDEFVVDETDGLRSEVQRVPLKVIAENLRSAFNVGAIFRTSECLGVSEIVLSGYTPGPDDEKIARTAMGTAEMVPWRRTDRASEACAQLREEGYKIVALETATNAVPLHEMNFDGPTAFVLGNERFGLDDETLRQADAICRIPTQGIKNSMNVGVAFGIAAFEWQRQYHNPKAFAPIGTFHTEVKHPYEARRQATADIANTYGEIRLQPHQSFEQALEDLDGFERIWIVYQFHHNSEWKPKVMPPRGERTKRGVFATRAPYRPNPIGMSCVRLIKVDGLKVVIEGHDLLDGTPILDIKPYVPYADAFPDSKVGWLEDVEAERWTVQFSARAEKQIAWLEEKGVSQLRGFLQAQLEFDPLDHKRKRVQKIGESYQVAYRTWRAHFIATKSAKTVQVESIQSGYSASDLARTQDPYADKDLHREFLN